MDLLISFDGLKAGTAALKKLVQAFTRAGSPVATSDLDPRTRRTLGVNYRVVDLTMTDNQKVSLGVKSTGDIYEVKVNGQAFPITAQNDQRKAVGEIVKALDAGRAKHQAKLARQKVALPKGITTAAPRMEQKLAQASADLDAQIATAKARVNELRTELGEPVLDAVGDKKLTKRQIGVLDYIKTQINIDLAPLARYVKNKVIGIDVSDPDIGQKVRQIESLGHHQKRYRIESNGYKAIAIILLDSPTMDDTSDAVLDSASREAHKALLDAAKREGRMLRGVAHRNAEWKEGDAIKGDTVMVWDAALLPPWSAGQYPRVDDEGWAASSSLYTFAPATPDEVAAAMASATLDAVNIPQASDLTGAEIDTLIALDRSGGKLEDGDVPSKSGRDGLVERGLVERVDGDNILTAKGKGCAATLDSVSIEFLTLDAVPFQGMKRTAFASGLTDDAGEAIRVKFALSDGAVWEVRDIGAFKTKIRADSTAVAFRALQAAKQYRKVTSIGVLDAVDVPTNSFDDARVAEAQMIVDQLEAGAALDKADFSHALATLQIALDTVETNLPINLAEGDIEQANLEEKAADSFRAAIKLLQDQQAPAT